MRKQLAFHDRDRKALVVAKRELKNQATVLQQTQWELEVMEQRFAVIEAERDELYDRFVKTIYDVQQKSGFKNLLLERKLGAIGTQLEKKEAQVGKRVVPGILFPRRLIFVLALQSFPCS